MKIRKLTNEEIKGGMCLCGKYIQYRNQRLLSDTGLSSIF